MVKYLKVFLLLFLIIMINIEREFLPGKLFFVEGKGFYGWERGVLEHLRRLLPPKILFQKVLALILIPRSFYLLIKCALKIELSQIQIKTSSQAPSYASPKLWMTYSQGWGVGVAKNDPAKPKKNNKQTNKQTKATTQRNNYHLAELTHVLRRSCCI